MSAKANFFVCMFWVIFDIAIYLNTGATHMLYIALFCAIGACICAAGWIMNIRDARNNLIHR